MAEPGFLPGCWELLNQHPLTGGTLTGPTSGLQVQKPSVARVSRDDGLRRPDPLLPGLISTRDTGSGVCPQLLS